MFSTRIDASRNFPCFCVNLLEGLQSFNILHLQSIKTQALVEHNQRAVVGETCQRRKIKVTCTLLRDF